MSANKDEEVFFEGIAGSLMSPAKPNEVPRAVIILHGQAGHRNYVYQRLLANKLADTGFYSLRIDFRGCGYSDPIDNPEQGRTLKHDCEDIARCCRFLKSKKLESYAIVGHSRGGVAALLYARFYDNSILYVANISGRYRGSLIRDKMDQMAPEWRSGHYYEDIPRYGKNVRTRQVSNEIESIARTDMSCVIDLPVGADVLTMQGSRDTVVPIADSHLYANALEYRHTLCMIEDADHNFLDSNEERVAQKGRNHFREEVSDYITHWISDQAASARFQFRCNGRTGFPMWKHVDGVNNMRDFGGMQSRTYGSTMRYGYLFRSAGLHEITDEGKNVLLRLGIKQIFDLRSDPELANHADPEIPGITISHTPIFKAEDYSPERLAERIQYYKSDVTGFMVAYRSILLSGIPTFRTIFSHIRDHPDQPFIVHCTAGKDRTGVTCALILMLMDIHPELIAREYELTTIGLKEYHEKIMSQMALLPNFKNDPRGTRNLMSSKYETMVKFLGFFRAEYESVDSFLTKMCGFSDADIRRMRRNLLAEDAHAPMLEEKPAISSSL
ncbi:hypothetical protein CANCADRAFT_81941 [Tortispora caseinolytica NRRL Y-17796]|uniref:Tyrosine specific protein phosphatases domain-containing protein n=1 Tax=Tortispora caseinolytica NRRL Y-17796 TaxID=767744 RepID=A0A1E4TJZ6_9ASCO|nr:hypothetical protein CANCADRAFT_81941 [Tortispora caseinolytica NRRL Y-17796]